MSNHEIYRFDRFELRPLERLLYEQGQPTGLGGRAVDLLTVLVQERSRLVSKAELLERVWQGLVVEENNLHAQVSALRKVLGAKAIATVPGRGYRFCLAVHGPGEMPAAAALSDAAGQHESGNGHEAALNAGSPAHATAGDAQLPSPLPTPPDRLWGREADLAELDGQRASSLTTVVGPAGIGKTSFALAVAHGWRPRHRDGVAWIELGGMAQPELVVALVAQSLGLPVAGRDPLQALVAALQPLDMLLVIDNAEHVIDAVARLAQAVLASAPGVRLLVTSQLPLRVAGERVFRLGPLSIPPVGAAHEEALSHGAVALFVDQVRAADRHFDADEAQTRRIAELCRRLDGLALAIKLAAARVPLLGLQGVQDRLGERFKLLRHRDALAPSRQQTLLAALEWSHELLDATERAVFRRLGVLAGGFTVEVAQALARDAELDEWAVIDVLGLLVDRSLVMADAGEIPRYRLLDSMRDHALLKLAESGELARIRERQAQVMAEVMDEAYEQYWQQADAPWLARFSPEIDNVRVALDWAASHDVALAVRLLGSAGPLFLLLGLAPEYRERGNALQDQATPLENDAAAARHWLESSRMHWGVANTTMHALAMRAADAYRAMQDRRGLYLALRCVAGSGVLDARHALKVLDEMAELEQPTWPARLLAQRLLAQVGVLRSAQRMAEARRAGQALLAHGQASGLEGVVSAAWADLASIHLALGDQRAALEACDRLIARGRLRPDNFILHALAIVACVAFVKGDVAGARRALTDFIAVSRTRDWEWLGLYAGLLALLAAEEARYEAAAHLLGYASRTDEQLGSRDGLTAYAWSRAHAQVQQALDEAAVARLKSIGMAMDPEAVCAWALASPNDPPPVCSE